MQLVCIRKRVFVSVCSVGALTFESLDLERSVWCAGTSSRLNLYLGYIHISRLLDQVEVTGEKSEPN